MKVAVVMGGPSGEHDISLKSGQGVAEALARRRHAATPVVIPKAVSVGEACDAARRTLRALAPEAVFLALHGTFGEDGTIQQVCEELQMAYTGSDARASRLGMDKIASRRLFEAAGLHVPRWQMVDLSRPHSTVRGLAYPLVVKPSNQGSSLGVSLVRREEELQPAVDEAARYGQMIVIEEFIAGREVTAGVLGDEPLPVVEIRPHHAFFDFAAKYTVGETDYLVPAPLPETLTAQVQAAGVAAHRALGCRHLSRTDILVRADGTPVVLEVNTIPGFTPTSLVPKAAARAGISYDELCERLVLMAVESAHHVAGPA